MPVIDLSFVLAGTTIPLDHGYSLFSALCRVVPALHGDRQAGVHPIRGRQTSRGVLSLTKWSRLKLRLPSEEVAPYIALAGQPLELGGHSLRVGVPKVEALVPVANVASRLVTFRHALSPESFEANVRRELDRMGIAGGPQLVLSTRAKFVGQPLRRVLKIQDRRIVGYSLRVLGLSACESIRIQEFGLGGRRRMGCGVFVPMQKGFESKGDARNVIGAGT
jgi:CRISPR-associated endonuclease/helicase Cas3